MEPSQKEKSALIGRFSKYTFVSVFSFGFILTSTRFLVEVLGAHPSRAYGLTLISVLILNFLLMRYWVYADHEEPMDWRKQFTLLLGLSSSVRFLEWLVYTTLLNITGIHYMIILFAVQVTSFLLKFTLYDKLVFGKK